MAEPVLQAPSPSQLRDELQRMVLADLLGPVGGPAEEVDENVRDRYLVDAAKKSLIVVSFVAYKVPAVAVALAKAARRGVAVRLVLEDHDVSQGKVAFDALNALGPDVAAQSAIYVWPLDQRPKSAGQHGSLHAKCAVADGRRLLVSSANLTGHAFNLNIELGLMVRGGDLPKRVAAHWASLMTAGTLRRVR